MARVLHKALQDEHRVGIGLVAIGAVGFSSSTLIGVLLYREIPTPAGLAGIALILASIVLVSR